MSTRYRSLTVLMAALLCGYSFARAPALPLPPQDGTYTFSHRYAEQPEIQSFKLTVILRRGRITVINKSDATVFPLGVLDQGLLLWHRPSGQWIIAQSPKDAYAGEVGGCSDGPAVIDFRLKIYWTC